MDRELTHRYDFVYLFDVEDGNPNGDPDAGNLPRIDPETNHGLVTDVALKRKIRNYVELKEQPGCEVFVRTRQPLNPLIAEGVKAVGQDTFQKANGSWDTAKSKSRTQKEIGDVQRWLLDKYYDLRTFGAVLSTGPNAGQVRGPVQLTFARSIEPILPLEVTITRVTDVDKEEGEMGRKHIVPYGLYRGEGFVSAKLAQQTGFSSDDLDLLWESLTNMFDHDHSAARGKMSARALIVFEHASELGNAPAHSLFDRVEVKRTSTHDMPARSFKDYEVVVDEPELPVGVTVKRLV